MSKLNSVVRQTPVTNCIFCGAPDPTSEEHIIPAWVFRAFDKKKIPYAKITDITHILPNGELDAAVKVTSDDATSPILCTNCNSEFSGGIQAKASEILTPFFIGRWKTLTKEEIHIFVRWYTCFLMVREMQHDKHETISQIERQQFRHKGFIPNSLNIWIAPLKYPGHITNHRPFTTLDEPNGKLCHLLVFAVGHLLIVSFGADPYGCLGRDKSGFLKLKKLLFDLRFVQIRDFDRRLAISIPKTKPGYVYMPHALELTEILQLVLTNPDLSDIAPYIDVLPERFDLFW